MVGVFGAAPQVGVVDGMEPVHLPVGENVQARAGFVRENGFLAYKATRAEREVGGGGPAQGVGAAELGVGPGVFEGVDGAVGVPADGLGEEVRAERATGMGEEDVARRGLYDGT